MKKVLFVFTFSLLINGCASRANLEWNLNSWIGQEVKGLIKHWGTPMDINDYPNGEISYSWLFDGELSNSPIEGTIDTASNYCKITIEVASDNLVQSWKLDGNNCKV